MHIKRTLHKKKTNLFQYPKPTAQIQHQVCVDHKDQLIDHQWKFGED